MSILVESLKRLYIAKRVGMTKLETMKTDAKITQEEFDYITIIK